MTYDLSGVDVFFLAKELKVLEGAKVDKITQIDRKLFTIRFFVDKKKPVLRILVPELVNITEQKYESPQLPLGFCSFLRKYLQNARLVKVSQKNFERMLIFEFTSSKLGELVLILELFKPGNMILCKVENDKLIILNALERQEFKTRKIGAREEYVFPPAQNNPVDMSSDKIIELLMKSEKTLGKALATDFSLGGVYAEEIVTRAGLDKNLEKLSKIDAEKLRKTITSFFEENTNCGELKGKLYPVSMSSLKLEKSFSSFNEGLDSINIETSTEKGKTSEQKKKKSKTASLLEIQEKRIRALEKEIDENQKIGEFIYEHYQEFQKLIDAVHDLRAKNKSFAEIEDILLKNKRFKKLDKAKKTITMSWDK